MPVFGGAYTQGMLDRFGVPVTIGAVTAKCLRNEADEAVLGERWASLAGKALVLRCKSGTFPALVIGVGITIDGVGGYKAAAVRKFGSDAETTEIVAVKEL